MAIALWRLGTGESYRSTSVTFGVGKCTALNIVHEFVQVLFQIRENYISFPPNGRELDGVMQNFGFKHGLPQVAGVIDGTYIKIKAPKEEHEAYYNRKQCYSLVLQAVTDSECKFLDVSVGYPGSIHDARVFRRIELYRRIIAGERAVHSVVQLFISFRAFVHSVFRSFVFAGERSVDLSAIRLLIRLFVPSFFRLRVRLRFWFVQFVPPFAQFFLLFMCINVL